MKFISENGKIFETKEACLEADKKYSDEIATKKLDFEKKQKEKQEIEKQRKERAEEVQNAYEIYSRKANSFANDYGIYHTKFNINDLPFFMQANNLIDIILDL